MATHPVFSIILPFYRQNDHMQSVINDFKESLNTLEESYEIIVVINGESEATTESQERTVGENPRIIEGSLREAGWGRAILWGFARSRGKYICYTNTARTDAAELVRLMRYALVFNNWVVKSSRIERTRLRKWVSIFYNLENRIVLGTPVWDVNATPKIIPRDVFERLRLTSANELFDAELLYKAFNNRIPIIEIPILQWERRGGRSITNWLTAVRLFFGVLWLRWSNE